MSLSSSDVNLYIVGFMGTGKTTVGRSVAQRLGFECIDTDHEIETLTGRTIPEIFATDGEAAFRKMERDFIDSDSRQTRTVVACGGGLVIEPGMAEKLRSRGVVVCLHASIETILARTSRNRNRPLLEVGDPDAQARALFAKREPIYRSVGTLILTDSRPLGDIVAHVIRVWKRESSDYVRTQAGL
jgi:shikimate kinase